MAGNTAYVKISVYVPLAKTIRATDGVVFEDPPSSIRAVIKDLAPLGADVIGNYDCGSMTIQGSGEFRAMLGQGAVPSIGRVGELQTVEEAIISFVAPLAHLDQITEQLAKHHPYEKPGIDVVQLVRHRFDNLPQ
jgi:hypothetical protein